MGESITFGLPDSAPGLKAGSKTSADRQGSVSYISTSSSEDVRVLKVLRGMIVGKKQIVNIGVTSPEAMGTATSKPAPVHEDDRGEEALPQGYQEQLWRALDRRLNNELAEAPAGTSTGADGSKGAADELASMAASSTVSLFKRARRIAFSPESVNRRVGTNAQESLQSKNALPKKRKRMMELLSSDQLQEQARVSAVDGKAISAAARAHAAAAAMCIQPAQDNLSYGDYDSTEPQGTVTRVLRGLKANAILTGNMQASQHKRFKLSASSAAVIHAATGASFMLYSSAAGTASILEHIPKNNQAAAHAESQNTSAIVLAKSAGKAIGHKKQHAQEGKAAVSGGRTKHNCTGSEKLSEEERKARKRAKKQKQKQAQEDNPVSKAREKKKRAKRKAMKKAKATTIVLAI